MTSRKRRNTLDTALFNASSLAIIALASLCMHSARAQTHAQSSAGTTKPTLTAGGTNLETVRYLEAFERADKNGDGKLSKEEAENLPAIAQRFEQIDADKDGSISKAEYLEALKP
jgi:Ca2+-binding EF-hand superfamily protein